MPNTFYTPEHLAALSLELIGPDLNVAQTFSRSVESDFSGKVGYSVNVRKPSALAAKNRTIGNLSAIEADTIAETVKAITLTHEVYSAVDLGDAEMTLKVEDFAAQVIKPQTDAIVYDVEDRCADALVAVTPTLDYVLNASGILAPFAAARKSLRTQGVPMTNLYAVLGVDAYAALLEKLDLETSGTADALRSGDAGAKIRGFSVIENNAVPADRIVFYHRNAFHLAVRAPMVPKGAGSGVSTSGNGFAIRAIMDYDASTLTDRSVLSTFVGVDDLGMINRAGSDVTAVLAADPDVS